VGIDPCAIECPTGVCDPSSGLCVGCLDDGDCTADNPYCELTTQECVGCLGDEHCPEGWVCDPSTNSCSCTQDVQCAVDEACNDIGSCVPTDVPGGECVTGTECDPSLGCGAGYCLRCQGNGSFCNECEQDADCAAVYMCNTGLGSCVECLTTYDCLEGGAGDEICHPYGECGPPCTYDSDCPHDRTCDEFGRCVPPPPGSNCTDGGECPDGAQCVAGLCKACVVAMDGITCQACQPGQSDCTDGTLCDNDVFVCVECQNDADCSGGEVCNFGACAPP
jgi:Cys-rich repeat protein